MELVEEMGRWIKQGCQRCAVAEVLRKPMIPSEILIAAQSQASRIRLRDIWFVLRGFHEKGLVTCLNPDAVTGKLYCFSAMGRQVASRAFGVSFPPIPEKMDWNMYSWVVRASVRKLVITELGTSQWRSTSGMTASQIKRSFRDRYPIGKNPILRALLELKKSNLLRLERLGKKSRQKSYALTDKGEILFEILTR